MSTDYFTPTDAMILFSIERKSFAAIPRCIPQATVDARLTKLVERGLVARGEAGELSVTAAGHEVMR